MKMAKPNTADLVAADHLIRILNDFETQEEFDPSKPEQLRSLYDMLAEAMKVSPGFHDRIIGGMCHVILWDRNQIVDPDADTIELHPRLKKALRDSERLEYLLHHLSEGALRAMGAEMSETSCLETFRATIDTAIEANKTPGNLQGAEQIDEGKEPQK